MSEKTQQNAGEFFESISSTYKKKYTPQQIFHYYFFTERLEKATCNLSFKNKNYSNKDKQICCYTNKGNIKTGYFKCKKRIYMIVKR